MLAAGNRIEGFLGLVSARVPSLVVIVIFRKC